MITSHRESIEGIPGKERVSSGPLKIGDDWPGCFIRGDEAMGWAGVIERAMLYLPDKEGPFHPDDKLACYHHPYTHKYLASLVAMLKSVYVE